MGRRGAAGALLLAAAALPGCEIGMPIAMGAVEGLFHEAFDATVSVALPAPPEAAFGAASRELRRNGSVEISDPLAGYLRARVGDSEVRVVLAEGTRKGWSVATIGSRTIAGQERDKETARRLAAGFEKEARGAKSDGSRALAFPAEDTVEILVDAGFEEVLDTARMEIVRRARRSASDAGTGIIEAEVGGSEVVVAIAGAGWEGPSTITVKARDHGGRLQDRRTAGSLAIGIRDRLRQERLAKYARPDIPPR